MFTGIVEETGTVTGLTRKGPVLLITIGCRTVVEDVKRGDSIAVNGTCLTVVDFSADRFTAEAVRETQERTTVGQLRIGHTVNLERALRPADRLGGHFVLGHVDTTAMVSAVRPAGQTLELDVEMPADQMRYVVEKGSVAIDGISLTVARVQGTRFSCAVIPHTLKNTTLDGIRSGRRVNIETDILGKYAARLLPPAGGITPEWMREKGFNV